MAFEIVYFIRIAPFLPLLHSNTNFMQRRKETREISINNIKNALLSLICHFCPSNSSLSYIHDNQERLAFDRFRFLTAAAAELSSLGPLLAVDSVCDMSALAVKNSCTALYEIPLTTAVGNLVIQRSTCCDLLLVTPIITAT
jgi:hypothetical protein